jgi:glycosyltransferase involved in cell wall biosynthesis
MPFPTEDLQWSEIRSFLQQQVQPDQTVLAPNEFLEFFPQTYPYNITYALPPHIFDFAVVHKAMLSEIEPNCLTAITQRFHPAFANDVFVVYTKHLPNRPFLDDKTNLRALLKQLPKESYATNLDIKRNVAVVVLATTPEALVRSLLQILQLGSPVIAVNNGVAQEHLAAVQDLLEQQAVPLLQVPGDRGTPSALNMGISYWLADPQVQWISCFRDTVDVQPNLFEVLLQVQNATQRPLLTGRDAAEHPTFGMEAIAGYPVLLKRSVPGVHLHAHRDYWTGILPIPTPDSTQLAHSGRGTEEDWWITAWSPHSITKRGGYVICVPGLVRTFEDEGDWEIKSPVVQLTEQLSEQPVSESRSPVASADSQPEPKIFISPSPAPSAGDSSPLPSLAPLHVLLDGYNLQLTKGTGIKTYGLSLLQALKQMGVQVDVLLSRGGYKANEILDEVFFFDHPVAEKNWFVLAKGLLKSSAGPLYPAKRRKGFAGLVIKRGQYTEDFMEYATSFSFPQCYDVANGLYNKLKLTTNISVTEKIDIWHATYPLPIRIRHAKKITTIHDLIPLRLPYATLDDKKSFFFKTQAALEESAIVITVSEHSKQDILTYFEVNPEKIIVTYQPIALEHQEIAIEEVADFLEPFGLTYQNYILFVGAIEPKKNVGRLIEAYATLDTDMPLVIVGKKGWLWEDELGRANFIAQGRSGKQIKMLEYVRSSSLPYLYQGAYCLVFPSLYEGFGLPPIEAMTFGCPVITSNVSSLPEVCGNAALYVDPYDVKDIRQALEKLLGSAYLRQELVQRGQVNVQRFSRKQYIHRLHRAYTQALSF